MFRIQNPNALPFTTAMDPNAEYSADTCNFKFCTVINGADPKAKIKSIMQTEKFKIKIGQRWLESYGIDHKLVLEVVEGEYNAAGTGELMLTMKIVQIIGGGGTFKVGGKLFFSELELLTNKKFTYLPGQDKPTE